MINYQHILAVVEMERDTQPALSRAQEISDKTGATITAMLVVYDLSYDMTTMLSPDEREAMKEAVTKESAKFSQSEMTGEKVQRVRSTYKKIKLKDTGEGPIAKCGYCGKQKHADRSKECKAFSEVCDKCGKVGHFKIVCRSKKKRESETTQDSTQNQDERDNILSTGVFNVEEHGVYTLTSGDLSFNKTTGKWVQKSVDKGIKRVPLRL